MQSESRIPSPTSKTLPAQEGYSKKESKSTKRQEGMSNYGISPLSWLTLCKIYEKIYLCLIKNQGNQDVHHLYRQCLEYHLHHLDLHRLMACAVDILAKGIVGHHYRLFYLVMLYKMVEIKKRPYGRFF